MTTKYTDLNLTLPTLESVTPDTNMNNTPHLRIIAPDCTEDDLLQVIRDAYAALRSMEGPTRALELMVSDILFECHSFPDVAGCVRHIEMERNL